jgi:hypothetical protein
VGVDANVGVNNADVNAAAHISPGVNIGSGDQSVSSSVAANQQSTDINSSASTTQGASTNQSSTTGEQASASGQASGSASSETRTGATSAGSSSEGSASGASASGEMAKGLDRADQAAGEHGKHGRDNARAHQGSASGDMIR